MVFKNIPSNFLLFHHHFKANQEARLKISKMAISTISSDLKNTRCRDIDSADRVTFGSVSSSFPGPNFNSLISWTVIVREYYTQDAPTFLYLKSESGGPLSCKNLEKELRVQKLCIPVDAEISVEELRDHVLKASQNAAWEHWSVNSGKSTTPVHPTAVLVLGDEEMIDRKSTDIISHVFESLNVSKSEFIPTRPNLTRLRLTCF